MSALNKKIALPFDGILCKVCGAPVPANLLACPECCGLALETVPSKPKQKPPVKEHQSSLFTTDYQA